MEQFMEQFMELPMGNIELKTLSYEEFEKIYLYDHQKYREEVISRAQHSVEESRKDLTNPRYDKKYMQETLEDRQRVLERTSKRMQPLTRQELQLIYNMFSANEERKNQTTVHKYHPLKHQIQLRGPYELLEIYNYSIGTEFKMKFRKKDDYNIDVEYEERGTPYIRISYSKFDGTKYKETVKRMKMQVSSRLEGLAIVDKISRMSIEQRKKTIEQLPGAKSMYTPTDAEMKQYKPIEEVIGLTDAEKKQYGIIEEKTIEKPSPVQKEVNTESLMEQEQKKIAAFEALEAAGVPLSETQKQELADLYAKAEKTNKLNAYRAGEPVRTAHREAELASRREENEQRNKKWEESFARSEEKRDKEKAELEQMKKQVEALRTLEKVDSSLLNEDQRKLMTDNERFAKAKQIIESHKDSDLSEELAELIAEYYRQQGGERAERRNFVDSDTENQGRSR